MSNSDIPKNAKDVDVVCASASGTECCSRCHDERDDQTPELSKKELGQRGERAAAHFLEKKGFEILETNWSCFAGEADIIALDGSTLCFVEVKTRTGVQKGFPAEAVDSKKRARYEKIAACYLQGYDKTDISVRFDVISILVLNKNRAFLRLHTNAFSCDH